MSRYLASTADLVEPANVRTWIPFSIPLLHALRAFTFTIYIPSNQERLDDPYILWQCTALATILDLLPADTPMRFLTIELLKGMNAESATPSPTQIHALMDEFAAIDRAIIPPAKSHRFPQLQAVTIRIDPHQTNQNVPEEGCSNALSEVFLRVHRAGLLRVDMGHPWCVCIQFSGLVSKKIIMLPFEYTGVKGPLKRTSSSSLVWLKALPRCTRVLEYPLPQIL